ncbi:MAG: hypothetical protein CTY15_02520 [Methylocystis sp.]|nr:MAG: hypothetical protein CTY15_02520 [Methylocystis sp.]
MRLLGVSKAGAALIACLLFAACGKEERAAEANDVIETQDEKSSAIWLRANEHIDPALWLASREAGRELSASDPAVETMREAIVTARAHFLESHRMLANRTAQIGKMLAEDGRAEDYAGILHELADVAKAAGQTQTYGELCQHYYNLRHKGATREEALAVLAERYKAQKQFR